MSCITLWLCAAVGVLVAPKPYKRPMWSQWLLVACVLFSVRSSDGQSIRVTSPPSEAGKPPMFGTRWSSQFGASHLGHKRMAHTNFGLRARWGVTKNWRAWQPGGLTGALVPLFASAEDEAEMSYSKLDTACREPSAEMKAKIKGNIGSNEHFDVTLLTRCIIILHYAPTLNRNSKPQALHLYLARCASELCIAKRPQRSSRMTAVLLCSADQARRLRLPGQVQDACELWSPRNDPFQSRGS